MQFHLDTAVGTHSTGARVTSGLPNQFLLLVMISFRDSVLLCWSHCSCDVPSSLGDEWWYHRILHMESTFDSEADSPLSISFMQSFRLETSRTAHTPPRYSQGEQQSPLHASYFESTCVDFASFEPLIVGGNILASLVSSPFTILMMVSSIAIAIAFLIISFSY